MPTLLILLSIAILNLISCHKTETGPVYKGRLEIAGICGNYTLCVLDGGLNTSQVEPSWTDPTTNLTYNNVFGLSNPCDFPSTLHTGDTFSFRVIANPPANCAQCMAFYPTPSKKLAVQVVQP